MQNTKNENNTNLSQCLARQWIGPLLLCSKPPQGSLITMLRAVLAIVIGLQFFLRTLTSFCPLKQLQETGFFVSHI